ncbi:hypothetical protein GCM10023095_28550 [Pseudaeromonas paramecii]|uniref:Uncharacterized protein n=1 Tax=Pseudaeromonas paramecii TaxID=2138166 RepID=A0ABP8QGQ6_9GAMM
MLGVPVTDAGTSRTASGKANGPFAWCLLRQGQIDKVNGWAAWLTAKSLTSDQERNKGQTD